MGFHHSHHTFGDLSGTVGLLELLYPHRGTSFSRRREHPFPRSADVQEFPEMEE
jgi:hypothetical protein